MIFESYPFFLERLSSLSPLENPQGRSFEIKSDHRRSAPPIPNRDIAYIQHPHRTMRTELFERRRLKAHLLFRSSFHIKQSLIFFYAVSL